MRAASRARASHLFTLLSSAALLLCCSSAPLSLHDFTVRYELPPHPSGGSFSLSRSVEGLPLRPPARGEGWASAVVDGVVHFVTTVLPHLWSSLEVTAVEADTGRPLAASLFIVTTAPVPLPGCGEPQYPPPTTREWVAGVLTRGLAQWVLDPWGGVARLLRSLPQQPAGVGGGPPSTTLLRLSPFFSGSFTLTMAPESGRPPLHPSTVPPLGDVVLRLSHVPVAWKHPLACVVGVVFSIYAGALAHSAPVWYGGGLLTSLALLGAAALTMTWRSRRSPAVIVGGAFLWASQSVGTFGTSVSTLLPAEWAWVGAHAAPLLAAGVVGLVLSGLYVYGPPSPLDSTVTRALELGCRLFGATVLALWATSSQEVSLAFAGVVAVSPVLGGVFGVVGSALSGGLHLLASPFLLILAMGRRKPVPLALMPPQGGVGGTRATRSTTRADEFLAAARGGASPPPAWSNTPGPRPAVDVGGWEVELTAPSPRPPASSPLFASPVLLSAAAELERAVVASGGRGSRAARLAAAAAVLREEAEPSPSTWRAPNVPSSTRAAALTGAVESWVAAARPPPPASPTVVPGSGKRLRGQAGMGEGRSVRRRVGGTPSPRRGEDGFVEDVRDGQEGEEEEEDEELVADEDASGEWSDEDEGGGLDDGDDAEFEDVTRDEGREGEEEDEWMDVGGDGGT